jgi:hypothetical protein
LLEPLPGPVSRKEEAAAVQLETVDRFLSKLGLVFELFTYSMLDHRCGQSFERQDRLDNDPDIIKLRASWVRQRL